MISWVPSKCCRIRGQQDDIIIKNKKKSNIKQTVENTREIWPFCLLYVLIWGSLHITQVQCFHLLSEHWSHTLNVCPDLFTKSTFIALCRVLFVYSNVSTSAKNTNSYSQSFSRIQTNQNWIYSCLHATTLRLSSTRIRSSYQLSCCNQLTLITSVCVCVCICLSVTERERNKER